MANPDLAQDLEHNMYASHFRDKRMRTRVMLIPRLGKHFYSTDNKTLFIYFLKITMNKVK